MPFYLFQTGADKLYKGLECLVAVWIGRVHRYTAPVMSLSKARILPVESRLLNVIVYDVC